MLKTKNKKNKKIYLGSDHAGFKLKEKIKKFLIKKKYEIEDLGPYKYNYNDDYPDYALKVCEKILETGGLGILICSSGQGMDRVANKILGIHAAVCWNKISAKMAKEHGNVNVLCLGERTVSLRLAKKMVLIWLETPFTPKEKHIRRINKIKKIEKKYLKCNYS